MNKQKEQIISYIKNIIVGQYNEKGVNIGFKKAEDIILDLIAKVEQRVRQEALFTQLEEIIVMVESKRKEQGHTDCGTYAQEVMDDLLNQLNQMKEENEHNPI